MLMVELATYISGKWVFKDGFQIASWSLGWPRHYLYVFVLALWLWLFPNMMEIVLGFYKPSGNFVVIGILLAFWSSA